LYEKTKITTMPSFDNTSEKFKLLCARISEN